MNHIKLAIAAGPLATLALTAPASAAAHARVYDIGHCTAAGTDAECTTGGGQINRPARIREGTCYVTASASLHTFGGKGSIVAWLTAIKR